MLDVRKYKLVSDQVDYAELQVIIRELNHVLTKAVPGDIVELGCYNGTTSLFLRRLLDMHGSDERQLHAYDSFQGLPDKTSEDTSPAGEQFKGGELKASKNILIRNFKQAGLKLPQIHTCWFEELRTDDLPESIAFAFLDGDFYTSIKASLEVITPSLQPGSVILVDDYQSEALPGAKRATDEWARKYNYRVHAEQSLAIIRC